MKKLFHIDFDPHRVFGLDILRALAILFVVIKHGSAFVSKPVATAIRYVTLDGVSLFFVLSGFLIGTILLKTITREQLSVRTLVNFWIKRWMRTLPNYFLVLIVLIILSLLFVQGFRIGKAGPYFFFLQNFKTPHPDFFQEAWSLSVEEWFYLLVPVMLFGLGATGIISKKNAVLVIATCMIVASAAVRYYRYKNYLEDYSVLTWDNLFRKQVITRMDSIMFGVVGAWVAFYSRSFWLKFKTHFFIAGMTILIVQNLRIDFHLMNLKLYACEFSFIQTSVGVLFLLPFLSEVKTGKGFFFKFFTTISLISYSMYLVNYSLVREFIVKNLPGYGSAGFGMRLLENLVYYGLVFLISLLLYKYFEKPVMGLRDRIGLKETTRKPVSK